MDGGQILHALLWFVIGRGHSLMAVSVIGLTAGVGLVGLALWLQDGWLVIMAVFIGLRCITGFQQARAMQRMMRMPRHHGLSCPDCGLAPIKGPYWTCGQCGRGFDIFASAAACPHCGQLHDDIPCLDCGHQHPVTEWAPMVEPAVDPYDQRMK
jgi:DNA-directed RNA polymerase subunit RPC12/RpoP